MDPQDQVTVLDYWRVIWRARWSILALTTLAAIVAFGIGRLQPKVYTARATILPPRESGSLSAGSLGAMILGGAGGRGGQEGGGFGLTLPGISLALPTLSPSQDYFLALLKSRTMREEVFAEFAKSWGPSVGSMVVSVQPDTREKGIIGLAVEAKDPKLAAELANYYFSHLDRMLRRYGDQAVKFRQNVYTTQLERAASEVEAAEAAVLKFQSENRFLALDTSTKREVDSVATGRGAIMGLELQLETMRLRFTDQHPQIIELKKQIAGLKQQYSKSLFGGAMDLPPESPTAKGTRKEFFVPAAKMTPVQFAFLKLYRNLKIQEAFYTAALHGLQQIKYEEGLLFTSQVELLDPAVPSSAPSRPNLLFIVWVAAVSALIMGILFSFILEYLARVREQERQARRPSSARTKRPDDGSGLSGIAEAERGLTVEPRGSAPAGRTRGTLTGGSE